MRQYRFFTSDLKDLSRFGEEIKLGGGTEKDILDQLSKVLRVKPGDEVVLIPPGQSPPYKEFHYLVDRAHRKEAILKLKDVVENNNEPDFRLELILCIPNKPDKLAFIMQKAVELGVSRITLVQGQFSQMKHELRRNRLMKIMKEAAEQSERAYIPELTIEGELLDYLEEAEGIFVAMERDDSRDLRELFADGQGDVSVLIGPEGGFSDEEKESVRTHSFKTYTLGKRILRMETAVILTLGIASLR